MALDLIECGFELGGLLRRFFREGGRDVWMPAPVAGLRGGDAPMFPPWTMAWTLTAADLLAVVGGLHDALQLLVHILREGLPVCSATSAL